MGLLPQTLELISRHSRSLALLLVIANAIHLNQVFLLCTAGSYPIGLRGTLPFNINHRVRLHPPHCVLVTSASGNKCARLEFVVRLFGQWTVQ